jgi:hypothetical protein
MVAKRYVPYIERICGSRAAQRASTVAQLPFPIRKGFQASRIGLVACAAGESIYHRGEGWRWREESPQ